MKLVARKAISLLRPLYARRNEFVASTPALQTEFWPRVFSAAPAHVYSYVLSSDSHIISQSLRNLTLDRFEVDENGVGEPRSVRFIFEFDPAENEWFEGDKIVKEFYWRKEVTRNEKNGKRRSWEGLVSRPVRIQWKEGMDPTKGLLDAVCDLDDAEEKEKAAKGKLSVKQRKSLAAYEKLREKVAKIEAEAEGGDDEGDDPLAAQIPSGMSFFAWFGYRGKDISAAESKVAGKEDDERFQKITKGEDVESSDEEFDDEEDEDDDGINHGEVFPDGEELATAIGEDLWPNALKYYGES